MKLFPIYISGVFLSLNYAAILYVNSSFLNLYFSFNAVSILFVLAALGNIALFLYAAKLLRIFGPRILFSIFLFILFASTFSLGLSTSPLAAASSFIIYSSVLFMVYWCLDIFLEEASANLTTGSIRGLYLSLLNAAIAIAPLLMAFFSDEKEFKLLYMAAGFLLIPPLILSFFAFRKLNLNNSGPIVSLYIRKWWGIKDIRRIILARFLLEFFYMFMIIYMPVYLHKIIGFSWPELSIMFSFMLLPFVILEWPAGKISDEWLGEKEMLSVGFLIIFTTLLITPFLGKSFVEWMALLFVSRIGASLVEISSESYFFKQINYKDTSIISSFRLTRPFAMILCSMIGGLSILLLPFSNVFWILAAFEILGLTQSLYLVDTL